MSNQRKVALIGNPNAGKTSLFNELTGLNQQVGNFPGVTIDKKIGYFSIDELAVQLIDLPGTYSLNPSSQDEEIVLDLLKNPLHKDYPELIVIVVDFTNLERNLLLFFQVKQLNIPCILVCNMMDIAEKKEISINFELFKKELKVPVVEISAKKGKGITNLKTAISIQLHTISEKASVQKQVVSEEQINAITSNTESTYQKIKQLLNEVNYTQIPSKKNTLSEKLDNVFTHPILGYLTFIGILFLVFQAVFSFAETPMDWIDSVFQQLSQGVKTHLPEGTFTNLLAEGIVPGIGGVVIFIPQITLLFLFIAILEESGYMARVVFIMDRIMRPLGLSGRSVVPLVSSVACAIPAIMATRTISNWKEKIITIMVAPLVSCSARIPVYTLLIALVIPDKNVLGIFNLKGIVLLALYGLGFFAVLISALLFKGLIRKKGTSFLILELPEYRSPKWKNTLLTLWEKVKIFVWDAGKIILAVSIILWALASFGPKEQKEKAVQKIESLYVSKKLSVAEKEQLIASSNLENSYIGILGKTIEPAIQPLGYDWKIGIALITSFAAREVFVGSMATIYSVGEDFEEDKSLLDRMREEKNVSTGKPVYSLATGISLMIFYAFAMQCMSTLAIVKRETKSWKWPMIQLAYMSCLAYGSALLFYQIFS